MKKTKQTISFVNWIPSMEKVQIKENVGEIYFLDPQLAGLKDRWWTGLDQDLPTLNKVYGELFDQVVMKGKSLMCYWPSADFSPAQNYELNKSLGKIGMEFSLFIKDGDPLESGYTYDEQEAWKEFVFTLIESICEDLELNEGLEEVMTLKSKDLLIEVLKLVEEGEVKFVYYLSPKIGDKQEQHFSAEQMFDSFDALVLDLLSKYPLSSFAHSFRKNEFEKAFYKELLNGDDCHNLVLGWEQLLSKN